MSEIETHGGNANDSSDWNQAWEAVSRLAAARGTTLSNVEAAQPATDEPKTAPVRRPPAADLAVSPAPSEQLARDIAEIKQAAAALRRAEPSLEPRLPDKEAGTELRGVRSVWVLIALIWLSAASVVSCAIGVIFLLFG